MPDPKKTCRKGKHRWTLDRQRCCAICGTRRTRMPKTSKTPPLVPLAYGSPYCELCKRELVPPEPVGRWTVSDLNGGATDCVLR
jgi:hypothetical protein